jgi:GR25 family glycosyltransferase involved in LPS biosynthesis
MDRNRPIFVINLEHRTDRRRAMEKELSKIGWNAEFFPAIRPAEAADFPSIGARGCFLSHLAVLRRASETEARRLILVEDDVNC